MKSEENDELRVVLSTAPSVEEARRIGRELVERRLAACVNIVPGVESVYRWDGRVETAAEAMLVIKTERAREAELFRTLKEIHGYEVPEGLSLPVAGGIEAYLKWVKESVVIV
jgi:periplasmic divalent cation tolerance protein